MPIRTDSFSKETLDYIVAQAGTNSRIGEAKQDVNEVTTSLVLFGMR